MKWIFALLLWMHRWRCCCTYALHASEEVPNSNVDYHQQQDKNEKENLRDVVKRLLLVSTSQFVTSSASSGSSSLSSQHQQMVTDWRILLQAMHSSSLLPLDHDDLYSLVEGMAIHDKINTNRSLDNNRQIRGLFSILNKKDDIDDCMEGEFDVSSTDFSEKEAIDVLVKCRIVVLRNVFRMSDAIDDTANSNPFQQYVTDIDSGRILEENGGTSFGGDANYILAEDDDRFNYMLTRDLVEKAPQVFANPKIISILSTPQLLGPEFTFNHGGIINSYASWDRPKPQYWHIDGTYVHGDELGSDDNLSSRTAAGGHDMPPFAINMFTPLINITVAHGPTEFCVGTSWLRGLDLDDYLDQSNDDLDPVVIQLIEFEQAWQNSRHRPLPPCPLSRRPLLNTGDVVLFDYMLTHRGGPNVSDELRSLMFAMYSRKWFRDTTFDTAHGLFHCQYVKDNGGNYDECVLHHITQLARFAVVETAAEDDGDGEDSATGGSDDEL